MYSRFFKPTADFVAAALILMFGWPIMLVLWLINYGVFRKPIFSQTRIGFKEQPFNILKFRTLRIDGDENSIPAYGKFLRSTSLDELPQLINILSGEMSFVGPRPLLPEYVAHYTEVQNTRHLVRPGITGLAQVSGRNTLSWQQSLQLDAHYAAHASFGLDLKILLKTIFQVFKIKQVNQSKNQSRGAFHKENKL